MASRKKSRMVEEPDPFALDPHTEEFFATGDRPSAIVEKIELTLEEEDAEVARRSAPEVILRRRRYRRLVARVVCAVGVLAMAALAKSALGPANASSSHATPTAVAESLPPPPPEKKVEEIAKADPSASAASTTPAPSASAAPDAIPTAAPEPLAKVAHHAPAKRDDDFSDLDVKIDIPKIDMSKLDVSVQ